MREGDVFTLADGTTETITRTYGEKLDEPVIVYNFDVQDFHTYYVADIGVLVHNNNCRVASADEYAKQVSDKTKVNGTYNESDSASDILRGELYGACIPKAPYSNAAHHIVPWRDSRAQTARNILDDFGVQYNSAANGVLLLTEVNQYVGKTTLHVGNHGASYIELVTNRLQNVVNAGGKKSDIVAELNNIRSGLLSGTIKLN